MASKSTRYALGFVALMLSPLGFAQGHYALGPVESSNSKVDILVLGQRFTLDASTVCTIRGKVVSKAGCTAALSRYAYAVVEGDSVQLSKAARITVLPFSYVPGASTVMVGARITAARPDLGVVSLSGLTVDNTALLSAGAVDLAVGTYLEVSGTQPAFGSTVLADGIRYEALTITGTGRQLQTITGTGRQLQTITGTGIQTITGTGIQTITGTGIQTITGSGTQTITGTGIQAQTITGTGMQTQTITGTGRQLQTDTITGTGRQLKTDTITGTGRQLQTDTITGTGRF
jgi:hypothetical protein